MVYIADSNGGNVTPVVSDGLYGYELAIDQENGKIYYGDTSGGNIYRANLDGANSELVVSGLIGRVHGMYIDEVNKKFYWSDRSAGEIYRADLDGSNKETIISGLASPRGLFIR